jgi:3-dehydrosphinganine reductase
MGRSVGRLLAQKGANIIIVARTQSRLEEAISYISAGAKSPSTQRFHQISADLTSASECSRVIAEATAWNHDTPPDIVWCCAGGCHPTLFIDTPVEILQSQMDQNYFSTAYIAHATLRQWLQPPSKTPETVAVTQKEPRHLIFTSSVIALYTFGGYSPYAPAKCALRSLSDTLSNELNLYSSLPIPPVKIHTIFPATIFTESYEAENKLKPDFTKKLEEDDGGQTPDQVAEGSIKGLEAGDELVTSSFIARALMTTVMGGSRRNGWGILDLILGWIVGLVIIFVRKDHDSKVREWGRKFGTSGGKA